MEQVKKTMSTKKDTPDNTGKKEVAIKTTSKKSVPKKAAVKKTTKSVVKKKVPA